MTFMSKKTNALFVFYLLLSVLLAGSGCTSKISSEILGPAQFRPRIESLKSELNTLSALSQDSSALEQKQKEALDYLDDFLEDHPESFVARYQRARWRFAWGMGQLALDDIKKLESLYDPQPECSALGGLICYRLGLKRESREYFRSVLSLDPQNKDALLYTGLMLAERGRHEQARRYLARAMEIDPNDEDIACWSKAQTLVSDSEKLRTINPNRDPLLAKRVGILLVQNGRYQEGIRALIVAMRSMPDDVEILMPMAHAFARRNMRQNAMDLLERVVTLDPTHTDAWMDLGSCYSQAGKQDDRFDLKARNCFLRAAQLRPEQSEPLHAAAKASARMGDLLGAMEHYDAALKIKPCSADLYLDYGLFLARNDQLLGAEQLYREAMDLYPDETRIKANLMTVLFAIGRFDDADQLRQELGQERDLPLGVRTLLSRYEGGEL